MRNNAYPIVWIIGATRSSKSYLARGIADYGSAGLRFHMISTSQLFREKYGHPDTYSRKFVFNLSAFSANTLAQDEDCNVKFLLDSMSKINQPCVVEGERNPNEFAKLYDPKKDVVFFLKRENVDIYDTTIERGIPVIEQIVRWNVSNGITPQESVAKMIFGNGRVTLESFGVGDDNDEVILDGEVGPPTEQNKYPWILPMIGAAKEMLLEYYGPSILGPSPCKRVEPQFNAG